jgi:DNA-binding transcriptional ArsR family regulator
MAADPDFATVALLIGEPTRAAMLAAVLGGQALPASELAYCAGVSPQTASMHLAKLVAAGFMRMTSSGRHRYYALGGSHVAEVLEQLSIIARPSPIRSLRQSEEAKALRFARTCYDHLAGVVGVALTQRLLSMQLIEEHGTTYTITAAGFTWLEQHDINPASVTGSRRAAIRRCLDWSERCPHVAGAFGATLTTWLFDQEWMERVPHSRTVRLTAAGREGFRREWRLQV